jgi:large subunit ribosomal protein L25
MSDSILNGQLRRGTGNGPARQLRMKGFIPGIYYTRGEASLPFAVNVVDLKRLLRSKHTLITFQIEGQEPHDCVIREIQRDPVTDACLHLDLMGIKADQTLTMKVVLHLVGVPEGVKTGGGILQHTMNEIEIECLPKDIPQFLEIDVSDLSIGQSRHISDLKPPNIKILEDPHNVIATVVPPTVIKETKTAAEVAAEAAEAAEAAGAVEGDKTEGGEAPTPKATEKKK